MLTHSPYFRQINYASPLCMHEDLSEKGSILYSEKGSECTL